MRCLPKKLWSLPLFLYIFMLIYNVSASPYYLTKPTYFPFEKGGPYINFPASLLPMSFNTLYQDSQGRWHFNNYWIWSDADVTITKYFTDSQLKLTISKDSGNSTFQLGGGVAPTRVLIDGTLPANYTFSGGVLTVTVSHASSHEILVDWGTPQEPPSGGDGDETQKDDAGSQESVPWGRPEVIVPRVDFLSKYKFPIALGLLLTLCVGAIIYSVQHRAGKSNVKSRFKQKFEVQLPTNRRFFIAVLAVSCVLGVLLFLSLTGVVVWT